jgi:hypothetical protein
MAILPRTLLTQPAPAAVAAVSLLGFTILGMSANDSFTRSELHRSYAAPCAAVEADLGARQYWQESDYIRYASCFEQHHDARGSIEVSRQGLQRFPTSQILYNLKGYNEIGLREFDDAVETLETGIQLVGEPTNGVMENNLAWAYLWTGDGGTEHARALYETSLSREPYVCEALHTGLFIEFEIARNSSGIAQADALRNFQSLRTRYTDCENRDGSWDTAVETTGAAVLFSEAERLLDTAWDQQGLGLTMRVTAKILTVNHPSASVTSLCNDAMPLGDLRDECVDEVQHALRVNQNLGQR